MKLTSILLFAFITTSQFAQDCSAVVTYYGPTPYAQRADSPFAQEIANGTVRLEDFEDELLNSGFISTPCADVTNAGRPSVDEDDGTLDGFGTGRAMTDTGAPNCEFGLEFIFVPDENGRLPNFVGFTIVGFVAPTFIDGNTIYRATASIFNDEGIQLSDNRFYELPLVNLEHPTTT
jgi:hypothetical protein